MIKIYISPSCSSCRKVKEWFECQNIPHELINIFSGDITKDDIKEILRKSLDGTDEIISTRSNAFKNLNKSIDDMTLDALTIEESFYHYFFVENFGKLPYMVEFFITDVSSKEQKKWVIKFDKGVNA